MSDKNLPRMAEKAHALSKCTEQKDLSNESSGGGRGVSSGTDYTAQVLLTE